MTNELGCFHGKQPTSYPYAMVAYLNKSILIALALLLVGCAANAPEACSPLPNGKSRPVVLAPFRTNISLDGKLDDWQGVPFTSVTPQNGVFDPQPPRTDSPEDLSFRFAVCHDADALYIAVEVTDDSISTDSCPPGSISCPAWDDDAVEVFIDGNHNHAPNSRLPDGSELKFGGEFALIANGAANSDYSGYPRSFGERWQGATNWKSVQQGDGTVRYEMRITWNAMGGNLRAPGRVGFSLSVQDDDEGGRRDHALYFIGAPDRPFTDERWFADLLLSR